MSPARIPVTLLTGFLGAGKTTLLNRLIAEPGFARTAVIVNEFGEAGVDGLLVETADGSPVAMTVGCLCCTVSGDVRETLTRMIDDADRGAGPAFDRVVIETTGLADPAPLLQTILRDETFTGRCALNGVVTLLDAVNAEHALSHFEEAQRQVAVADLLLITKADLARDPASARDLAALRADARRRNPDARILDAEDARAAMVFALSAADPAAKSAAAGAFMPVDGLAAPHAHQHAHNVNRHGDAASAYAFTATASLDLARLNEALSALQASFGPDLLRVKGLIGIADTPSRPLLIHIAGHAMSPPRLLDAWPAGIDATRIVLIVGGASRAEAPAMFKMFLPALRPFATA